MREKLKSLLSLIFFWLILGFLYIFLFQIYLPRVNAFGCFDDCFNYVAGYFLLKGKTLYSEIFFNHQPLMAYISKIIQLATKPINIYELVLRHRQFLLLFGFLMNCLLIWRFSLVGLGFALIYELTKFYLFGDRFLAEGLVVYLLVYMTGLLWNKFTKRKIYPWEYIFAGFLTWVVIFAREPVGPLALVIYSLILWGKPFNKAKKFSLLLFFALSGLVFLFVPFRDYVFNVFVLNLKMGRATGVNIFKSFFYPVFILFTREKNLFSDFLFGLNIVFLILFFWLIFQKKSLVFLIFLILGLANLRAGKPGAIFYAAFQMLPWYGILIFTCFLLLLEIWQQQKKIALFIGAFLIFLLSRLVFSSQSWIRERPDPHKEFLVNFGYLQQVGEVVKALSEPNDTLFLDGFDDLIYWQADRLSSYKYSWYTSFMPYVSKYAEARFEMFAKSPPDFYYGTCSDKKVEIWMMPKEFVGDYQQLYSEGKPSCLYIRKTKISKITAEQWQKAKEIGYELPKSGRE